MKLRLARSAVADLDEIWIYIAKGMGFKPLSGLLTRLRSDLRSLREILRSD